MNSCVSIQGLGLITPLGSTAAENWAALRAGETLCDRGVIDEISLRQQEALYRRQIRPAALGNIQPDRVIRLALVASCQALQNAAWLGTSHRREDTALFVATSKGPILSSVEACAKLRQSGPMEVNPSQAWHITHGASAIAMALSAVLDMATDGTSVGACAGAFIAVHRARQALLRGQCRRALVVAADASLHPIFEHSFENLGLLARPDADGHRRCRPFAPEGGGFFISEAAAAICLEMAEGRGNVALENSWIGADATHLVSTDPQASALRRGLNAIAAAGVPDFVHAHAPGTRGDQIELTAIRSVFGTTPNVFSHKQWLGHSLGAAGLVGLVLSTLCHQHHLTLTGHKLPYLSRSITIGQGFGGHIGLGALTSTTRDEQ